MEVLAIALSINFFFINDKKFSLALIKGAECRVARVWPFFPAKNMKKNIIFEGFSFGV